MILISDLYNTLIDLVRADKRGESLSVEEFNRVVRICNQELFDEYAEGFEDGIENADSMGGFKVINYPISLTLNGEFLEGSLPDDYFQLIGKPKLASAKRVDLVTEYEHSDRCEDYLTQATLTHPYCIMGGLGTRDELMVRVLPITIVGDLYLSYLRTIVVPYLDYYIDNTTFTKTFLSESSAAQSIPSGTTYRDGTLGGVGVTKVSLTKNLEWDDSDLNLLLGKLMTRIGVQLPDEFLAQAGMADQIKSQE